MATRGGYAPSVIPEDQLAAWLEKLRLNSYSGKAKEWCQNMGAVSVQEILENREDFVGFCNLKPLERRRVEKDAAAVGVGEPPPVAKVAPPAPFPAPSGGVVFGPQEEPERYAMGEELGNGATATVCRCTRQSDGQQFAVKSINLGKLRLQPNFQKVSDKLHREVSILFTLRHPRIVSLFDVVEGHDQLHLVMELVEGGELFDHIVQMGSFTEPVARYVFIQIAEGLRYIHGQDIVYRDLKPENILVDQKNSRKGLLEIKLSDFGHSKLINDGYSTALTRVGTPQYWAPEVSDLDPLAAKKGYTQQVDLWSLGVVLYVMLVGAYPFDGVREPIERQIRRADVKFPNEARRPSQNAQELIRALIRVNPEHRLSLDGCLTHPWISSVDGSLSKIIKLCAEKGETAMEERLPLPVESSKITKEQVETLRRDLHQWTRKFRCAATVKHGVVVANMQYGLAEEERTAAKAELLDIIKYNFRGGPIAASSRAKLAPVPEEQRQKFKLVPHTLRVSGKPDVGAGLRLEAEAGGMRVLKVFDEPGQPGLCEGDLIIKIREQNLRGQDWEVENIFGKHFGDGAPLTIRRNV